MTTITQADLDAANFQRAIARRRIIPTARYNPSTTWPRTDDDARQFTVAHMKRLWKQDIPGESRAIIAREMMRRVGYRPD